MNEDHYDFDPPPGAGRIKRFFFSLYKRFIRIRGTPEEIAWGVAIGFFVAMSPTMGIQTYIAIPLAAIAGVSKVSAAIAVWLTNPLTAPFFYGFNYMIGAMVLNYPLKIDVVVNPSWIALYHSGKQVLYALLVGGFFTGTFMGIVGYFFIEGMIKTAREKAVKLKQLKDKIKPEDINKLKEKLHVKPEDIKKIIGKIPVKASDLHKIKDNLPVKKIKAKSC